MNRPTALVVALAAAASLAVHLGAVTAGGTGTPPSCSRADINGDGVVDGADLGALLAEWGPVPACSDGDPCTQDLCVDGACQHVPINCDDGNPCTIDSCVNGVCQHVPNPCDDGNPCTIDTCVNGACQHTPKNCDDGNFCTIDTCVNGVCVHQPRPNGTQCTDGNPCTAGDTCSFGVCVSGQPIPGCTPLTDGCVAMGFSFECCQLLCNVDPTCCDGGWDAACAQIVMKQCSPE